MEWKQTVVALVFKEGDRQNTSNYRLVNALAICMNNFERLIHDQLYNYVTNKFSAFYFLVSTIRNTPLFFLFASNTP